MKIVVTGGIGSGKSMVASLLASHPDLRGHNLVSLDLIVHDLYFSNERLKWQLKDEFGTNDRKALSDLAFRNPIAKDKLEEIFQPYIMEALEHQLNCQDVIFEFPLYFEKGQALFGTFDVVVSVVADAKQVIKRVMNRDNFTEEKVLSIIKSQTSNEFRIANSNVVIYNNGEDFMIDGDKKIEKYAIERAVNQIKCVAATVHARHGKKIGIISGSFDPITLGHAWIIEKALTLCDFVVVGIAHNEKKKYLFKPEQREVIVWHSILERFTRDQRKRIIVEFLPEKDLLVDYADKIGARFIFRGIRNATDFAYENELNLIQRRLAPHVETLYLMPPKEIIEISSTLVKGALAYNDWQRIAAPYVPECVLPWLSAL